MRFVFPATFAFFQVAAGKKSPLPFGNVIHLALLVRDTNLVTDVVLFHNGVEKSLALSVLCSFRIV
jgi:hypothetical protein